MKRIMSGLLVACLCLSMVGCSINLRDLFYRGIVVMDEQVCPTVEMAKEAASAALYLLNIVGLYQYYQIFDNLSKGICVTVKQWREAMDAFDKVPIKYSMTGVSQKPVLIALRRVKVKK